MRAPYPPRRHHPPETWIKARADYMAGMSSYLIEATHGIRRNTLFKRAQREGWKRTEVWASQAEALTAAGTPVQEAAGPVLGGEAFAAVADQPRETRAVAIADTALREALKALDRGDAREAAALIKAGDAVGEFADFVQSLRSKRLGAET